ncbi:YbhB/YbcL family Raf kinase inhibitor-like protein [Leifsonia poae]|uniref:YbhB/YbcL family Raf kinase inhibitor-like protein n=1 Tax=Leifsonia poae TaxID=110933 RepID=UPI003D67FD49
MHPVEVLLIPLGKAFRNRRADETASISRASELATDTHFELRSPSFNDGEEIPAKHCSVFIGDDISPGLTWGVLPDGTADLVLLMEDIDSPGAMPRIHALAAFAPTGDGLPEGALTPDTPGMRFAPGRRGPRKYAGPRPLPGHGPHRYRFHLYALDSRVDLAAVTEPALLPSALEGHVLASGTLMGSRTT